MPEYIDIMAPSLGIRGDMPSTMIDPRATLSSINIRFNQGVARKRPGYEAFSAALTGQIPRLLYTFRDLDGSYSLALITQAKFYSYSTAFDDQGVVFTMTANDLIYAVTTLNQMLFTNQVDPVQTWNGTGAPSALGGAAGYGETNHVAKSIATYAEHTFLIAPTEGGAVQYQRVRWSNIGTVATWTGGTSSFVDLISGKGDLLTALQLPPYLFIYSKNEVIVCRWAGGSSIFGFDQFAPVGCSAGMTVCDIGGQHIFLGEDNVYVNTGSEVRAVGDGIKRDLFSTLNTEKAKVSWAMTLPRERLYLLFVPSGSSDVPDTCYEFNYHPSEQSWAKHQFGRDGDTTITYHTAGGVHYSSASKTWDGHSDAETWDTASEDYIWDMWALSGLAPLPLLGSTNGAINQLKETMILDAGVDVDSFIETFDATPKGAYVNVMARWQSVEFEATGNAVNVYHSTDEGNTWVLTVDSPLTVNSEWNRYIAFFDVSSRKLRIRFEPTTGSFQVRHARLSYLVMSQE